MLIDRTTLGLIVRIHELGTISAAARELRVTPSLATRKLAAAERALGIRLFVRSKRDSRVTEAGETVSLWARKVLADESAMHDQIASLRKEISGPIRFACPEFVLSSMLSGWIANFMERHPGVSLSMFATDRPVQLAEERFDIAVHLGKTPNGDLVGRKLSELTMGLYATPAYIQRHGMPSSPEELTNHRLLRHSLFEDDVWRLRSADGATASVPLSNMPECTSAMLTLELMMQGAGILNVARRTMQIPRFAQSVVPILPDYDCFLPGYELWGVWLLLPAHGPPPRVRVFADELAAYLTRQAYPDQPNRE